MNYFKNCNLCPRKCNIDRTKQKGLCGFKNKMFVARTSLHYWEEPPISSITGSGCIFFSGCNLKCIFCQNKEISTNLVGKSISIKDFSDICLNLEKMKAKNINLVTPTHFVPLIIKGIKLARKKGLKIPIVYNSSGYEDINTIKMLDGYIDIYLPDFKYYDDSLGVKYSNVYNYSKYCMEALKEMYRQVGPTKYNKDKTLKKGMIVRHLVLPDHYKDSLKIIKYLYDNYKDNIIISIMNQYTPLYNFKKYPNLNRKITNYEYNKVINYALDIGVKNAFIQEGDTQKSSFIPDFKKQILLTNKKSSI